MAKKIFFVAIATVLLFAISCNRETYRADQPAYLSIPALDLKTNYQDEGSAHSDITTVWVFANNQPVGAFELPCIVPILDGGLVNIEVYAGIDMNGIDATRAIYSPYQKFEKQIELTILDTAYLDQSTIAEINYSSSATIFIAEDFDETGQNLVPTLRSDTTLIKTSAANEVFINPDEVENNGDAGKIVLVGEQSFFEVSTIDLYNLPKGDKSVFLEMSYKNDIPMTIGVIAHEPGGTQQAQTLFLYASSEWKKIYVNLVTEINSVPAATGYQIFIGGIKPSSLDTAKVYLDNLKITY